MYIVTRRKKILLKFLRSLSFLFIQKVKLVEKDELHVHPNYIFLYIYCLALS